jgi:hypothetical protein
MVDAAVARADFRQATAYLFQCRRRALPEDADGIDFAIASTPGIGVHEWSERRAVLRRQLVRESLAAYLGDSAYLRRDPRPRRLPAGQPCATASSDTKLVIPYGNGRYHVALAPSRHCGGAMTRYVLTVTGEAPAELIVDQAPRVADLDLPGAQAVQLQTGIDTFNPQSHTIRSKIVAALQEAYPRALPVPPARKKAAKKASKKTVQ